MAGPVCEAPKTPPAATGCPQCRILQAQIDALETLQQRTRARKAKAMRSYRSRKNTPKDPWN